ncbi:MAG: hypothetical protein AAGE43_09315 [Pseudomonadota bacterium]
MIAAALRHAAGSARNAGVALCLVLFASPVAADGKSYLEVSPHGRADLEALMTTLEGYLDRGLPMNDPVIVILHGSEADSFTSRGYERNRMLIDRAALLSAYELLDFRMCETWMSENDVQRDDLPAFIETVPFAPEEVERLEAEGYTSANGLSI